MSPRRSRRGNFTRGRLWLVFIFLLLRALDYFLFSFAVNKHSVLGPIINGTLWSIALLSAIWFRMNWARYAMVILLLVSVGLAFILEASFAEFVASDVILVMATFTAGQLVAALMLIFFPSIQKLTNNAYL